MLHSTKIKSANFESIEATLAQKLQKSNPGYKKVRTCRGEKYPYNSKYRGQKPAEYLYGGLKMALSNLFGWNKKMEAAPAAACGSACGTGDKPEEKPAACGSACGAGDQPAEAPAACGAADK